MNETVIFTFDFSSTFTVTPPEFCIKHNSNVVYDVTPVNDFLHVELPIELPITRNDTCILEVERSGFDSINEQLLRIDKVAVDGINLKKICYSSKFYPIYPEPWISEQKAIGKIWPEFHYGWVEWGWNGKWVLKYQTPIYTWLLENV